MFFEILFPVLTLAAVLVAAWFLGGFIVKVFQGERTWMHPVLRPVERLIYRITGVDETSEQTWIRYAGSMLLVTVLSLLFTFLVLRYQDRLPFQGLFNPSNFPGVDPDLAFNTAVSFTTNTNWQNYAGEATMSYFSQLVGLVFHQFLSAATGIALAVALIRGIARRNGRTLGNFYVDITRAVLYLMLPISIVATLLFVAAGSIQNLNATTDVTGLAGVHQLISQGPVAAMEAIKDLGNNGGGFFNANSAHPFENPNGFTNALTIWLELTIPFALFVAFGRWVGRVRQGLALAAAALVLLVAGGAIAAVAEQSGSPAIDHAGGVTQAMTDQQSGGNLEGKEVRFGAVESGAFAAATTGTSTGSVNSGHDSFTPIGGMVPLVLIQLGEITPGGIGAGLYGLVTFAIVAVFLAGLMVGRTPEYLGKKIESRDVKYAALAVLILPATILGCTAIAVLTRYGQAGPLNPGAHGFSEILYSYSSQTGNNGSAFAGLTGNTFFYNVSGSVAMWAGRFLFVIPILALAGNLVRKQAVPESAGTLPTDTPLFTGLLVGVIVIVGALTFLPALALGPILEQLQLHGAGITGLLGVH